MSVLFGLAVSVFCISLGAQAQTRADLIHEGVATCSSSVCHNKQVPMARGVQQNEVSIWQSNGDAGAHSRAWQVLHDVRAQRISERLGLGPAQSAPACLGCHLENATERGQQFQESDGIGCEACHGASGGTNGQNGWLVSHATAKATHAQNVANGMIALDDPKTRAETCLNCHYGSNQPNQFVSHRMMAAGHPQITFETDFFSAIQSHYRLDANYAARKMIAGDMKFWAVGQAVALKRALTVYDGNRGGGVFPEFYFFDCQSCHRAISIDPNAEPRAMANPGRPIPAGTPPFNDSNMIMLLAAIRADAPDMAPRFDSQTRAFHAALAESRESAVHAASELAETAGELADRLSTRTFSTTETRQVLNQLVSDSITARYTDWSEGVQAYYAVCNLETALQPDGYRCETDATLNDLFKTVADPNDFRPGEFRRQLQRISAEGQH